MVKCAVIDPCLQCVKNTNGVTCAALREIHLKNMTVSFQSAGLLVTVWRSRSEKCRHAPISFVISVRVCSCNISRTTENVFVAYATAF